MKHTLFKSAALFTIVAIVVITFAACASDVANRYYGSVKYPPRPVQEVEVLTKNPSRPYTVIADFQSRGETVSV